MGKDIVAIERIARKINREPQFSMCHNPNSTEVIRCDICVCLTDGATAFLQTLEFYAKDGGNHSSYSVTPSLGKTVWQ